MEQSNTPPVVRLMCGDSPADEDLKAMLNEYGYRVEARFSAGTPEIEVNGTAVRGYQNIYLSMFLGQQPLQREVSH